MQVSENLLNLLEFDQSLFLFEENLRGELGQSCLSALVPCANREQLEKRQELLRAWRDCRDRHGDFPWNASAVCVSNLFPSAKKSGMLRGEELLKVRLLLSLAMRMRVALGERIADYPAFEFPLRRLRDFDPELSILSVLEDSGRLADNASPQLQEIRNELESLKRGGRKTAARLMEDSSILNMLQERSLAYRDGRFLLLVRQEYVNRFPGLLVDRSTSGNSVYMEPRMLSSLNNSMMLKARDEQEEEHRILIEITRSLLLRERAIQDAENVLGELDLLYASCEVIRKHRWTLATLSPKAAFKLVAAKHPLLKSAAVPIDVFCGYTDNCRFTTLVVTGPNTGGKTVVLKTAGLCILLTWCGLPAPMRDGSFVGDFDAVYADIGDEQSIEQNLSTFSAHLKNIIDVLKKATSRSLVLLDELGAGTDPQEGAALGIAILETLKNNRALTLATTHHNPIKQYALSTPSVETASMEFDVDKLAPTYRLLMGVPGKSNALLIAQRYGMPGSVLELAHSALKARKEDAEEVMDRLNERRAELERAEREIQTEQEEIRRLKQAYHDRVEEIELQKDKIIEAADRRAATLLMKAEHSSKELIKDLEEAAKSAAHKVFNRKREDLQTLKKGLEARASKRISRELEGKPDTFVPAVGMTVAVAGSGIIGLIDSIRNGKAKLIAGPMNLEVPLDQLLATEKTAKVAAPLVDTTRALRLESVPSSLMVRGMNVDEALPLVSSYLDRAYRAGYASVLVIHGRGEGILRREIHALCSRLKYVGEYRLGGVGEGGYGVTVVSFTK